MELAWVLGIVFLLVTVVFMVIAVFLPEWVGIQGKKAKSIQQSHKEGSSHEEAPAPLDLDKK